MVSVVTTVTDRSGTCDITVQHPDADDYIISDTQMLCLRKSGTGVIATYSPGHWKSVTIVRDVK